MNEDSSKFVDKLAMEKLINEKISKVRHSPDDSLFKNQDISLQDFDPGKLSNSDIISVESLDGICHFQIPSYYQQPYYIENNHIDVYLHPSANPRGNILFIHGLFDDNRDNFAFLIKQLCDRNFNVFFMVLPYHFHRKPKESSFAGEYFFSADLYRTRMAYKQAVLDMEAAMQLIGLKNRMPAAVIGYSMGASVAFRYFVMKEGRVKTLLINPVTDLKWLPWDNHLLLSIGKDLRESNLGEHEIQKILMDMDPCENINSDLNMKHLTMFYSLYDQIIHNSKYVSFVEKTGIKNVLAYPAGHLNVFRVPRLAGDIHSFINGR